MSNFWLKKLCECLIRYAVPIAVVGIAAPILLLLLRYPATGLILMAVELLLAIGLAELFRKAGVDVSSVSAEVETENRQKAQQAELARVYDTVWLAFANAANEATGGQLVLADPRVPYRVLPNGTVRITCLSGSLDDDDPALSKVCRLTTRNLIASGCLPNSWRVHRRSDGDFEIFDLMPRRR
ncbi:hypothetical protein OZX72_08530 [Bifidobacterium sp. ESL0769]|uniref:hypothetical protein n=1 Tax=Bifidobacterium sp. ESL0769 TaxID=2983229 RepID=UPI0023F7CB18|nr:hypothetical protein [Bifidobacterium sp. ESL0769]WEV67266.1 hypothetical protein OZX72_08530 [Bifidobacterium sp. ESL0769]